jgi:hypothetical protein
MPAYLYADNVSPRDRFTQLELQLDSGTAAVIHRGRSYDLSATEASRATRFIVLTPVSSADAVPVEIARLPIVGTPEDGDVPVWRVAYGAFVAEQISAGGGGGGGGTGTGGNVPTETADTFESYKIIMLSTGVVKAIPASVDAPTTPTSLAAEARLSSVHLTWTPPTPTVSGVTYAVWRGGVQVAIRDAPAYRDLSITPNSHYNYQIQAIDTYGQRSPKSTVVSAFTDPALNVAPAVAVTAWPPQAPTNGRTLIRINASDPNAQSLVLALGVNSGTVTPTDDPSVYIYAPA